MPKPLRVRRVNQVVGLFVLLALAILFAVLVFGPQGQRWFMPTQHLLVRLPPEGSLGLRRGSDVQILGSVVGSVDDIVVTPAGDMIAKVSVRGNFIRFVRGDSRAVIRKPLGIGDASVEITRGHGEPLAGGALIDSSADKGPTELMEETLVAIRNELLPTIRELRLTVSEYRLLAADVRGQQAALQQALAHLNRAGAALESGQGVAGMLLFDPAPRAQAKAALKRLDASMVELNAALRDARTATRRLPQMSAELERILGNVRSASAEAGRVTAALVPLGESAQRAVDLAPGVLLQGQETLRQAQRLTEGVQRSWLVRGSMEPAAAAGDRLPVEGVGSER